MSRASQSFTSLARLSLSSPARPILQTAIPRGFAPSTIAQQRRTKVNKGPKAPPPPKVEKSWPTANLKELPQYTLCDSMRYLRAREVGQDPYATKYTLSIRFKALKTFPPVRNRMSLPNPVFSDSRVAVICKEDSPLAAKCLEAGAVAAGQESIFAMIREDKMNFDVLLCVNTSEDALRRAELGRILGPKGMMPSAKLNTISPDVLPLIKEMTSSELYREEEGVVKFKIGHLSFTPEMVGENIKYAVKQIRADCQLLAEQQKGKSSKSVFEVMLSTENGGQWVTEGPSSMPIFSLNGRFAPTEPGITSEILSGGM